MENSFKEELILNGVSVDKTLERFMNNEALYLKFLGKFLEDKNFCILKEALKESDSKSAFESAHTMKGVASNLGLDSLGDILENIVLNLRNDNLNAASELIEDLEEKYEKICMVVSNGIQ